MQPVADRLPGGEHVVVGDGQPGVSFRHAPKILTQVLLALFLLLVAGSSPPVTARVATGEHPCGIASGFGAVWVANDGSGTLARVDPKTNRVTRRVRAGRGALLGRHGRRLRVGDELPHGLGRAGRAPQRAHPQRRGRRGAVRRPRVRRSRVGDGLGRRDGRRARSRQPAGASPPRRRAVSGGTGAARRLDLGRLRPLGHVRRAHRPVRRLARARPRRREDAGVVQQRHARPVDHGRRQRSRPPRSADGEGRRHGALRAHARPSRLRAATARSGYRTRRSTASSASILRRAGR